jgi:IS605 OrfB family transposase
MDRERILMAIRTTKNRLYPDRNTKNILKELCHRSKNLYNAGLYLVRQDFFQKLPYKGYNGIYREIKNGPDYKAMHKNTGQQTLRKIHQDMKSFFENLKEAGASRDRRKIRPPRYKDKEGYASLYLQKGEGFRVKDGVILISLPDDIKKLHKIKYLAFQCPKNIEDGNVNSVEIIPGRDGERFYLAATTEREDAVKSTSTGIMAIDLGLNNLISQIDTVSGEARLISGRAIKSVNQRMNKTIAFLKSEAEVKNRAKSTRRIEREFEKRNNKISDMMHKVAKSVVRDAAEKGIGLIVIGHNKEWKNEINIGDRNNQNFVQIPHSRLIAYIRDKAELIGIEVREQNESHTSKCDALAFEPVRHHDEYLGRRKKRGMFKSSTGMALNADINGCLNILRKYEGNDESARRIVSMGRVFRPVLCRIFPPPNTKLQP